MRLDAIWDSFHIWQVYAVPLGNFSEYAVMTFLPIREVTLEGRPYPDGNLRSILSIHLKFSKYLPHIKIWVTLNFGRDSLRND